MKTSRCTDRQIIAVLKEAEAGTPVPALCRTHGISTATFYKWRSTCGGMDVPMVARMKELEDEHRRLKKRYVEARHAVNTARTEVEIDAVVISPPADNQFVADMIDPDQRQRWMAYHADNARLRIVCREANLSDVPRAARADRARQRGGLLISDPPAPK